MADDRKKSNKIDLSIVIVSWNVSSLLQKCLYSIYQNQDDLSLEVFVVDNNSMDGSAKMISDSFPEATLIKNKKNLGFAKANNQAIKKATGEYVLLLNPDTEILGDGLQKSLKFMKSNSECGVMGPKMLFENKTLQPSVRRFPKIWPIFLMFIKAPKVFESISAINNYLYIDFDYTKEQEVDQVMGAYMLIPKKVLDKVGNFDERFFVWFEEVDLCKRIWGGGYKVIYNPNIEIIHPGGKSFSQQKAVSKQFRFFMSAFKYFLKNRKV